MIVFVINGQKFPFDSNIPSGNMAGIFDSGV